MVRQRALHWLSLILLIFIGGTIVEALAGLKMKAATLTMMVRMNCKHLPPKAMLNDNVRGNMQEEVCSQAHRQPIGSNVKDDLRLNQQTEQGLRRRLPPRMAEGG